MLFHYLKHLFTSKGPDRIHSPFVFDLYYYCLKSDLQHYSFKSIEQLFSKEKQAPFIGESLFKIVNKLKPESTLYIHSLSHKHAYYCAEGYSKNIIYIKENIRTKYANIVYKDLMPTQRLDFLVLDETDSKIDLKSTQNFKFIFISNIKLNKTSAQQWEILLQNPFYNIVLDCFYFGIVFHKPKQVKEYFKLRF